MGSSAAGNHLQWLSCPVFDDDCVTLACGDLLQRFVDHQTRTKDAKACEGDRYREYPSGRPLWMGSIHEFTEGFQASLKRYGRARRGQIGSLRGSRRWGLGLCHCAVLNSTHAHDFSVRRSLVGLFNECTDPGIRTEILGWEEQFDVGEVRRHSTISSSPGVTHQEILRKLFVELI